MAHNLTPHLDVNVRVLAHLIHPLLHQRGWHHHQRACEGPGNVHVSSFDGVHVRSIALELQLQLLLALDLLLLGS